MDARLQFLGLVGGGAKGRVAGRDLAAKALMVLQEFGGRAESAGVRRIRCWWLAQPEVHRRDFTL